MAWDEGLSQEQKKAASHLGRPARLLAGPGTGKTRVLTRRICFLVHQGISPENILAVTFTRTAARELRRQLQKELGQGPRPRISTLHSFALQQLLKGQSVVDLPEPLRIADDWEERWIILEDLKRMIGLRKVDQVDDLMKEMSADWQSLKADEENWGQRFPNPKFLGAWEEHRKIYGYTLRSEMVYRLKEVLEQRENSHLEVPIRHFLVDEYQDLNRCDLEVVRKITLGGAELFVAGDDDQSIYGFRKAHPKGIRRFLNDYVGSEPLDLKICKRCDRDILSIGLEVIKQDSNRIYKEINPESDKPGGEFAVLCFKNQEEEARNIAELCSHFAHCPDIGPGEILILLRSDHNGVFSRPIQEELIKKDIPVATDVGNPLDSNGGRTLLAFMRLAINNEDSLAWRTLFKFWCRGVGPGAINAVYDIALKNGETFAKAIYKIRDGEELLPKTHQSRVCKAIHDTLNHLEIIFPESIECENSDGLLNRIRSAANSLIENEEDRDFVLSQIKIATDTTEVVSFKEIIQSVEVIDDSTDREFEEDRVRIFSMHRAKGLTSKVVIVAAAEDQHIPGHAQGEEIDEERRLMYVSLTRAKHHLFVTYCQRRTGQQRHYGRNVGQYVRTLSRFLKFVQEAEVKKNYNAFMQMSAEYHAANKGKFALMKSQKVVALFDSHDKAYNAGKRKFPGKMFSIQKFGAIRAVLGHLTYAGS